MINSFREYWVALKRAVLCVYGQGVTTIFYCLRLRPRLATG
jgi:hypothetical protein